MKVLNILEKIFDSLFLVVLIASVFFNIKKTELQDKRQLKETISKKDTANRKQRIEFILSLFSVTFLLE